MRFGIFLNFEKCTRVISFNSAGFRPKMEAVGSSETLVKTRRSQDAGIGYSLW
jgi:hypothetical protein